jgi:hypothetical protein
VGMWLIYLLYVCNLFEFTKSFAAIPTVNYQPCAFAPILRRLVVSYPAVYIDCSHSVVVVGVVVAAAVAFVDLWFVRLYWFWFWLILRDCEETSQVWSSCTDVLLVA